MKENKIKSSNGGKRILIILGTVVCIAAIIGLAVAYNRLRDIWLEQCIITDVASQVSITDGKMVRSDVIAYMFGLKNGANLALIDFDERRKETLKKIPNIREISIARHLPDKVSITVEERVPVVRLGIKGEKKDSGRVADTEGVGFISSSGTQMLPIIREAAAPGTEKGHTLSGRALAALKLLETCREEFRALAAIEADISKPDYIPVVLGNDYSIAKVAWDGMDDPSDATQKNLEKQLESLTKAYTSRIDDSIRVWDASLPPSETRSRKSEVYGDTKKGFL